MAPIEEQLIDSSRLIIDIVVANVGQNQQRFDEAVQVMLTDKSPISMRAARVVQFVSDKYPEIVKPHLDTLIKTLPIAKVDGVKRGILGILCNTPFPISDDLLGQIANTCFNMLDNENEPIAVRAQSIDVLLKIAKKYPELVSELIFVMEKIVPEASVGLKGKCRKTIVALNKVKW